MNKKEFENLIIPLNEKELRYREHPEEVQENYNRFFQGHKPGEILLIHSNIIRTSPEHGNIIPSSKSASPYRNLTFSKQTRFSRVPPHQHTYLEMFYVYMGQCSAIINNKPVNMVQGDVCIMDTQAVHSIAPAGENDVVLNCMLSQSYFHGHLLERLSHSGILAEFLASALNEHTKHDQYLLFHTDHMPSVREAFENAFCEYLDPDLCSSDLLESYMIQIFILLARCYRDTCEQESHLADRSYPTEVLRYIEQNYTSCKLNETAEHFGFHPQYLSRILKKATGYTFKELVDQNRLYYATFLLENTQESISDICARCGWSNIKQFYKKFEENYGCTPRQYRDQKH